jgi:hypothetical protein
MLRAGALAEAIPRIELLAERLEALPREHPLRSAAAMPKLGEGAMQAELRASEKLLGLKGQLFRTGPSDSLSKALRRLAATHAGTHAAARALVLADVAAPR